MILFQKLYDSFGVQNSPKNYKIFKIVVAELALYLYK